VLGWTRHCLVNVQSIRRAATGEAFVRARIARVSLDQDGVTP
jgi:hypothetical protein